MASACVNNNVSLLQEKNTFFDSPDWFNPRSSQSVDKKSSPTVSPDKPSENLLDLSGDDTGDFEFRLEDPVKMLPADELFLNGQLMPLHISTHRTNIASCDEEIKSASFEEILKSKVSSVSGLDPYMFSPKAPRCSSGWRELLGLKKLQNSNSSKTPSKTTSSSSLKHFMHKNPKQDSSSSLALPLLKESLSSDPDVTTESDYKDLPRVSLDSHKSSCPNPRRTHQNHPPSKVRLARRVPDSNNASAPQTPATVSASASAMGVSIDSPRMNSSGKVVFQSLERSSSSPSTFNGGPRVKYKGMERRSYSANVKVSPVLNVPVCSLRGSSKFGLGQLFPSPHKTRGGNSSTANGSTDISDRNRSHHSNKQKPPSSS